jgi:transposase
MRTDEHIFDENKRLKKELARVIQERDLLKKAAAYFAKESQ